ncbi:Bug family tripartite tricarboxylate transporter substrate binding protein [Roseomonas sp. GCM10028921]
MSTMTFPLLGRRNTVASLLALAAGPSRAQERPFPNGPVRIISPYAPGGGTDTTARVIGPAMGEFLGQPILVENRGGAGGSIGAAEVARSAPDGQTVLVDALGHVVNPFLLRGLGFDYAAFVPVTQVTMLPQVMIISPRLPAADMASFVAYAKGQAGQLSYGSSGNATGSHLASALFLRQAGLDMAHVPYRGGSAAMQDVLAGNVVFAMATVNSATQLILDGRLRALAVASDRRVASLPEVPTMGEAGLPGMVLDEWNGMFAPPGTPRRIVDRLQAGVRHALDSPAVRDRFAAIGAVTVGSDPDAFAAFVRERREVMGRLVQETGISIG